WGGATLPVAKGLARGVAPFFYLALRFALAAAVLVTVAGRKLPQLGRRGLVDGAILGTLLAAGYGLQTLGLRTASATVSAFLTGLGVVMVALLRLAFRRRPSLTHRIVVAAG